MVITYGEYEEAIYDGTIVMNAVIKKIAEEFKEELEKEEIELALEPIAQLRDGQDITPSSLADEVQIEDVLFIRIVNIPQRNYSTFLNTIDRVFQFEIRHQYPQSRIPNRRADIIGQRLLNCLTAVSLPSIRLNKDEQKLEAFWFPLKCSRLNSQKGNGQNQVFADYRITLAEDRSINPITEIQFDTDVKIKEV